MVTISRRIGVFAAVLSLAAVAQSASAAQPVAATSAQVKASTPAATKMSALTNPGTVHRDTPVVIHRWP